MDFESTVKGRLISQGALPGRKTRVLRGEHTDTAAHTEEGAAPWGGVAIATTHLQNFPSSQTKVCPPKHEAPTASPLRSRYSTSVLLLSMNLPALGPSHKRKHTTLVLLCLCSFSQFYFVSSSKHFMGANATGDDPLHLCGAVHPLRIF